MEQFRSQNGTAIGIFSSATANQSVALGYQLQATKEYTVSLGNDFIKRQITNMAAGTEDTDGVNVLQLKGANAEILAEANNYTDNKTAEIVTTVNNYTDQKAAETLNSANNYTDQKADETLTSANNYTNQKAAETLTSANDYTKSQVAQEATARQEGDRKTLQKANDYTDSKLSGLGNKVTNLDKRIDRNRKRADTGISGAMAMTAIPMVEGKRLSFGMAMAGYRDQGAVAAGFGLRTNASSAVKINTARDSQNGVGVAAGFALGW